MRYQAYDASRDHPNVVVDGSPNERTVLCISHWPGIPDAAGVADDLSAQMVFHYLDSGATAPGDAEVVTNNHFDQDGLVGVYALTAPEHALEHRELLIDIAAAGDFATYRDRRAARIAWVLSAWASPADGGDPFVPALERLPHLLEDIDEHRAVWDAEDAVLTASEDAVARGTVRIEEDAALDLAVVRVDPDVGPWSGSRFAGQRFDGVHPMALHNATDMSRLALVHGDRFQYLDRYETWVRYVSRPRPGRVDLRPLAHALAHHDDTTWRADPPGVLTPALSPDGPSSLTPEHFVASVREHLRDAPVAWDPAAPRAA